MGKEFSLKFITQKTCARTNHGPAIMLRDEIHKFYFEDISRLGPLNEYGAGQWMTGLLIVTSQILKAHPRFDLTICSISRFKQNFLARFNLSDWLDIRMPTVVASARIVTQTSLTIDQNGFHLDVFSFIF